MELSRRSECARGLSQSPKIFHSLTKPILFSKVESDLVRLDFFVTVKQQTRSRKSSSSLPSNVFPVESDDADFCELSLERKEIRSHVPACINLFRGNTVVNFYEGCLEAIRLQPLQYIQSVDYVEPFHQMKQTTIHRGVRKALSKRSDQTCFEIKRDFFRFQFRPRFAQHFKHPSIGGKRLVGQESVAYWDYESRPFRQYHENLRKQLWGQAESAVDV